MTETIIYKARFSWSKKRYLVSFMIAKNYSGAQEPKKTRQVSNIYLPSDRHTIFAWMIIREIQNPYFSGHTSLLNWL